MTPTAKMFSTVTILALIALLAAVYVLAPVHASSDADQTATVSIVGLSDPKDYAQENYVHYRLQFTRSGDVSQPLDIDYEVTETGEGDIVLPDHEGRHRASFAAGSDKTGIIKFSGFQDDTEWEEHTTLTFTVLDGGGYTADSENGSLSVRLIDNDIPSMSAHLTVNPQEVEEGGVVSALVTVTTDEAKEPHTWGLPIMVVAELAEGPLAAEETDFVERTNNVVGNGRPFTPVSLNGEIAYYRMQAWIGIDIVDDAMPEGEETFNVVMKKADGLGGSGRHPLDLITLQNSSVTVTILASEGSITSTDDQDSITAQILDHSDDGSTFLVYWYDTEECASNRYHAHVTVAFPDPDDAARTKTETYNLGYGVGSSGYVTATVVDSSMTDIKRAHVEVWCITGDDPPAVPTPLRYIDSQAPFTLGANPSPDRFDENGDEILMSGRPTPGTYTSIPKVSSLSTSPGLLSPQFNRYWRHYVATVDHDTEFFTVNTTLDDGYQFYPEAVPLHLRSSPPTPDADPAAPGYQVRLQDRELTDFIFHAGKSRYDRLVRFTEQYYITIKRLPAGTIHPPVMTSAATTSHTALLEWWLPEPPDGVFVYDAYIGQLDGAGATVWLDWAGEDPLPGRQEYKVYGLEPDEDYRFYVKLEMSNGKVIYSDPMSVSTAAETVLPPTGLAATATHDQVSLSWTVPAQPAWLTEDASLQVMRQHEGFVEEVGQVPWQRGVTNYSFTHTGLRHGQTYQYFVQAFMGNDLHRSGTVSVTTAALPEDPDGTRGGAVDVTTAMQNWEAVWGYLNRDASDAVDYYVFTTTAPGQVVINVRQPFGAWDEMVYSGVRLENSEGATLLEAQEPAEGETRNYTLAKVIQPGTHYVRISAWEDGPITYFIRFRLEELPNNPPVFDSASYAFSLAEDASVDTAVGTVSATDADSDTLAYTVKSGNGEGKFAIDGGTGAITTAGGLDYEITTSYALTVQVSDGNGGVDTASVSINVTDVKDTADPPTNLQATATDESVSLTWTAPTQIVAGYLVFRKERGTSPPDEFSSYGFAEADAVSYTDGLVEPDTGYTYYLEAVITGSDNESSDTVDVDTWPVDTDATRDGAVSLGVQSPDNGRQHFRDKSLDRENGDGVDYYTFTTSDRYILGLGVRGQSINLDSWLEDADGNTVIQSGPPVDPNKDQTIEWLRTTIDAGTYYIKVEAMEDGQTDYYLRFGLEEAPAETEADPTETTAQYAPDQEYTVSEQSQSDDYPITAVSLSWQESSAVPLMSTSISLYGLATDSDSSTTDYVLATQVLDSDLDIATDCEGTGFGTTEIKEVPAPSEEGLPNIRHQVGFSPSCGAGEYTWQTTVSTGGATWTLLTTAEWEFTVTVSDGDTDIDPD